MDTHHGHTPPPGSRTRLGVKVVSLLTLFLMLAALIPSGAFAVPGNEAANLDQCGNGSNATIACRGDGSGNTGWVNGNLGASKSLYYEGQSIPYRLRLTNLASGTHSVTISWDTTKGGKHALDYLTNWDANVVAGSDPTDTTGVSPSTLTTYPIPLDPNVSGAAVTQKPNQVFSLYGGTITSVSPYTLSGSYSGDSTTSITINFTATGSSAVLAWGGHISTRADWGMDNSAIAISGSPYHTALDNLDGTGGAQDRSLSANAVIFPGFIHVVKNTTGGDATFSYTASPSPLNDFSITTTSGTGEQDFNNITDFQTYAVTEGSLPTGWSFGSLSCSVASPNGGTQTVSGATATINLKEGEEVTCTYVNNFTAGPALSLVKTATPSTYSKVGDVISYSYLVTNTGNVTLAGPVTVTDNKATVTCPSGGLAVGASMTCTASYTITQTDLDAGSVTNTAVAHANGTDSNPSSQTVYASAPSGLTLVKVASPTTYSAAGQTVTYTYTLTNTGNVTLYAPYAVTDDHVSSVSCPSTPATLAPGDSVTCTGSYTITSGDMTAGSVTNKATATARVGEEGTVTSNQAQATVNEYTPPCTVNCNPVPLTPAMTVSKFVSLSQTGPFTQHSVTTTVGTTVWFQVTMTNTGQTSLTGVTLSDSLGLPSSCPTVPTSLNVGASYTCTYSRVAVLGSTTNTATGTSTQTGSTKDTATVIGTAAPTPKPSPSGGVLGATGTPSLPPTTSLPGQGGGPNGTILLLLGALGAASLALISLTLLRERLLDSVDR